MYIQLGKTEKKETTRKPKTTYNSSYETKLANEDFDSFTASDIVEHFERVYYEVNGFHKDHNKDFSIKTAQELLDEGFEPAELVENIDFVLRSDQDRIDRIKFGMGSFKFEKWIKYIDDNIDKFLKGESVLQKKKVDNSNVNRKREWNPSADHKVAFSLPKF